MFSFPEIRGREDKTFIYKVDQKTRAIITTYSFKEKWSKYLDIVIPKEQLKDIFMLDDLMALPVIIAVSFQDRMVFVKAANLYLDRHKYVQENKAFLPKEKFSLISKVRK